MSHNFPKCDKSFCIKSEACAAGCTRMVEAERVKAFFNGKLDLSYSGPDTFYKSDPDSHGHLWNAFLDDEDDSLSLDDRGEPFEVQIIAELRRLAEHCNKLADEAEEKLGAVVA